MGNAESKITKTLELEEFNLIKLFHEILVGRLTIISFTAITSLIALIYSLSLPNIYQSEAILVPIEKGENLSGALSSYRGLASLAGVNLPSSGNESNARQALQKLSSLSFFEDNILPNINLPELMAVDEWDAKKNIIRFDDEIFDFNTNTWVREISFPQNKIPSAQESFEKFKNDHLVLNEDKTTGFITIAIKHQSPFIAKDWVELILYEINSFYRTKDKYKAETAVKYINSEITKTNLTEIKQALAELLQQEIQKLKLIEANMLYVFDYIDPPAVMEKKAKPSRMLICILGALFGFMLGIVFVLMRSIRLNNYK